MMTKEIIEKIFQQYVRKKQKYKENIKVKEKNGVFKYPTKTDIFKCIRKKIITTT